MTHEEITDRIEALNRELAVAEVPIGCHRYDEDSNDYATSDVRQYLRNWFEGRIV